MRNRYLISIAVVVLALSLVVSCKSDSKTQTADQKTKDSTVVTAPKSNEADYSGLYVADSSLCKISVNISKTDKGYTCVFKEGNKEYTGTMALRKESDGMYCDFMIKFSNKDKDFTDVGGYFEDNKTLTIQNQGNAMNQYDYFKSYDDKYLQLIKK